MLATHSRSDDRDPSRLRMPLVVGQAFNSPITNEVVLKCFVEQK